MQENFIDLGLPSGTLWADRNVGASSPEGNGKYFTFEEAQELGKVPSMEQFKELLYECEWNWKGKGYEVVGPNGNSIYLPAAGYRGGIGVRDVGSLGNYWSSEAGGYRYGAYYLDFGGVGVDMSYNGRGGGRSVRLVK